MIISTLDPLCVREATMKTTNDVLRCSLLHRLEAGAETNSKTLRGAQEPMEEKSRLY